MSPSAADFAAYSALPVLVIIVVVVIVKSRPSHWHSELVGAEGCEGHQPLEPCALCESDWPGEEQLINPVLFHWRTGLSLPSCSLCCLLASFEKMEAHTPFGGTSISPGHGHSAARESWGLGLGMAPCSELSGFNEHYVEYRAQKRKIEITVRVKVKR